MPEIVEALVEGGAATAGPPLGPALGPLGVNITEVVKAINTKTEPFRGMKVPVKVRIDPKTKGFDIEVGTPPTSALVLKELGAEKGVGDRKTPAGNLTMEQVIRIADMKADALASYSKKARVKQVLGTLMSMGVTVDGKNAREAQLAINRGEYDSAIGS